MFHNKITFLINISAMPSSGYISQKLTSYIASILKVMKVMNIKYISLHCSVRDHI